MQLRRSRFQRINSQTRSKADTAIKVLIGRSLDAVERNEDTVLTAFTDGCWTGLMALSAHQ